MKNKNTALIEQPVPIRSLKMTTRILLHPDFVEDPQSFASRHGVDLVEEPSPVADFRNNFHKYGSNQRTVKNKANIHLVRFNAIRLYTKRDDEGDWLVSIDLNPSLLLYEEEKCLLTEGDLLLSLSILRAKVSPMLADLNDARHIVPGLAEGTQGLAYWSKIDIEVIFPSIQISGLHELGHPDTGHAEGKMTDRIQLGDKQDDCLIRFKDLEGQFYDENRSKPIQATRVRLILKNHKLVEAFQSLGTTSQINEHYRLVAFPEWSVAHAHLMNMAKLAGTYLPVPPEWGDRANGKPLTLAKAMALVSQLTTIPLEELKAMDEVIRHPSESTCDRLATGVEAVVGYLRPVPVSKLFASLIDSPNKYYRISDPSENIDPLIFAAYGDTTAPGR